MVTHPRGVEEADARPGLAEQHVVVLSGLSGAGKTTAAKLFEDLGYACVDNLPGELLPNLADLIAREPERFERVAVVLDARADDAPLAFAAMRGALEGRGIRPQVFFLEARDEILIRRFSETRHRHPLAGERGIADSIGAERRLLEPVRAEADVVVDTSELSLRELKGLIFTQLWAPVEPDRMAIQVISLGFKFGVPLEADVVLDVRFLENPYYVPALRTLSGLTPEVRGHVLGQPLARSFLDRAEALLAETIPAYLGEGKTRLTIAIGCTGGFHRSIVLADELAARLQARELGPVSVFHRELEGVNLRRWLRPGIGIKRWLVVVFLGEMALALAGAFVLRQVYRDADVTGPPQATIYVLTLQFLPYWARAVALAAAGLGLFLYGSYRVVRTLLGPFTESTDRSLPELVYRKRVLTRGPRVVALGGGTGLSVLLRGLKEQTANLTAIVSVADDGGSTGRLREQLGIPAVGDVRNCLVAMAETEPAMGELLQYRFGQDEGSLAGHAVGNLLIAAMNAIEGDFEEAIREMNRVLAVRGRVVPASGVPLSLRARLRDGTEIEGQSKIMRLRGIERVWLEPGDARAAHDAVAAIAEADLIVLGPGSLYTSVLPVILVPELGRALLTAPGLRVYAANVATQLGETEELDLADHVEALVAHVGPGLVDVVLANNRFEAGLADGEGGLPIALRWPPDGRDQPRLVLDDVVDPGNAHHHDAGKLTAALLGILDREGVRPRRSGIARSA